MDGGVGIISGSGGTRGSTGGRVGLHSDEEDEFMTGMHSVYKDYLCIASGFMVLKSRYFKAIFMTLSKVVCLLESPSVNTWC